MLTIKPGNRRIAVSPVQLVGSRVKASDLQPLVERARSCFEDNRTIFGEIVGRVDGGRSLLSRYMEETGRYAALDGLLSDTVLLLKSTEVIVDIAAATGHVGAYLIKKLEQHPLPDGKKRVFLLNEPFPGFLDLIKTKVDGLQADNATVRLCSHCPTRFPKTGHFKDGQVGAVLWANNLHTASDRSKIMTEAFRILRPGGTLIVIEEFPHVEIPASYMEALDGQQDAFLKFMILKSMARPMDSDAFTQWVIQMWSSSLPSADRIVVSTASEAIFDATRPEISSKLYRFVFTKPKIRS